MAQVDQQHRGAGGGVLGLEYLEVLLAELDLVHAAAFDRVVDGGEGVDLGDRVAEPVGARLREALATVAGVRRAVLAEAAALEVVEDQLERLLANLLLAARRERVALAVTLNDRLVLELLAKLLQVEPLVDETAPLQVLHPLQHLVHVAAGLQQQEVEQVHQVGEVLQGGSQRFVPLQVLEIHGLPPPRRGHQSRSSSLI